MILTSNGTSACTGFTTTRGGVTLVGNNNDWRDPDVHIKFSPRDNEKYGTVIIESKYVLPYDPDNINKCGGMNDQGLIYNKFDHPWKLPIKSFYKRFFRPISELEKYCLEHCSTVDDVVKEFKKYNLLFMFPYQSFFVDKNGNSVIIEGDNIIYKEDDYQVVTNFLQSQTKPNEINCWRYKTAVNMLENMSDLTIEYFTSICNATHQEAVGCSTQDSEVYNLNTCEIYLYFSHKFDRYIKINLSDELKLGEHEYNIPSLLEPENNSPPARPEIHVNRKNRFKYEIITISSDVDSDKLYYKFDFVDRITSEWIGPYCSGKNVTINHIYIFPGIYQIKVKARDIYGAESDWTTFEISVPRTKALLRFFDMFPITEQILNYII